MALDPEELQRRRQERAALRKKQEQEQRTLLLRLIVAAAVLLICGIVIVAIVAFGGKDSEPTQQTESQTAATSATRATEETKSSRWNQEETTVIHIKAAGDLNVTDSVVASGSTINGYDYTTAFMDVAPLLADADLTMLNFEGNVCGAPYGTSSTSAPQEMIQALRSAGVDILQVANSCSVNNGLLGLTATLNNIRAAGIEPVGAYATPAEFNKTKGYTICEVQGIKVAIVAFTKGFSRRDNNTSDRGMPTGYEDCVNLLYTDYSTTYKQINTDKINQVLKAAEAEDPDITIALLHWGSEYNDTIASSQESIVSLMQKRGVDVIIGSHPHMVHEIQYDEKTGKLVAYSLGDFFGDAVKGGTSYSIILDLEITMDNSNRETKVTGYSVTPIYTLKESEGDGQRRVVRITEAMYGYDRNFLDKITASAYSSMTTSLERITDRITPDPEEDD